MKQSKLHTITIAAICFLSMAILCQAQESKSQPLGLSVETLGVVRHQNLNFKKDSYGVGLGLGYAFNDWVRGHVRAVAYDSPDNWRGGVVDEGSALVEARLFHSNNGRISLSAIGGADRDFRAEDWGFSVGARAGVAVYGPLSLGAESRIRAWFKQEKDLVSSVFLQLSF